MTEEHRPQHWRIRHSFPRRRPPWWPEGETWPPHPPEGMERWHRMRRGFGLRAAMAFLMLFLAGGAGCAGTLWLLGLLGAPDSRGGVLPWIFALLGLIVLLSFARGMRLLALPLRDLIEAAGKVESGDLQAEVAERGPRELRSLARAFNAMLARLRANEGERRRLLADVTHELRTPVTVIQGNLEAMLDGVYPADADHLAPVLEESRILSRLIDDLRTLSLAESGALELHREPTDLGVLAGEVVAAFRAQAEAAGVLLRSEVGLDLPLAEIDPLRMREVLVNLTANSLRATPRGGQVRLTGALDPVGNVVLMAVEDTGRGIAPEDLPHVFDRFYRAGGSSGSGLGLAIARDLVRAHGGEITAESRPGAGTTVRLTIPLAPPRD